MALICDEVTQTFGVWNGADIPFEGPETHSTRCEHIVITRLHVTDLARGLRRLPAGFYVVVEFDGMSAKTSNKTVSRGRDVAEWNDEILLPSTQSSVISFQVYASFEHGARLGSGELLRQLKISVQEILESDERLQSIKFLDSRDELVSSCLSLRIVVEHRSCDGSRCNTGVQVPTPVVKSEVGELTDEGHHALLCYRRGQDQTHLNNAIQLFAQVLDNCSIDGPNRSAALFNLANAMSIYCQAHSQHLDLDVPIALYADALRLRALGHPDHIATALELGLALLARFQRRGDEMDKINATDLLGRVVGLSPVGSHTHRAGRLALQMTNVYVPLHARESETSDNVDTALVVDRTRAILHSSSHWDLQYPKILAQLGMLLRSRFEVRGDLVDIDEAASMLDEAVPLVPDDHADKPKYLNALGSVLLNRFERLGDIADIMKSVSVQEEALRLTPEDHPDKPGLLNNLRNSLFRRFERFGDAGDIMKSVWIQEEAVRLAPDGHPDKPGLLDNLGRSLFHRFERFGDIADITKSVWAQEEAVRLTPDSHPDKSIRLSSLGSSLLGRFRRLGDVVDIMKSVWSQEEAVRLTPDGHPDKPGLLNNLGSSLSYRFERLGDAVDITKSVSMKEEAVRITPDGHPNKPSRLNNLGNSFLRRFERLGDIADITKSVRAQEEAVRLTPDSHPDKPSQLSSLGSSLSGRFERFGDIVDITKSIWTREEALRLTPEGHPNKPRWLSNLGNSLFHRFERLGDIADITKSVWTLEEAVRLIPDGHPDLPGLLNNLGHSLCRRFERLGDITDITKSVSIQEEAVRLTPDGHPDKPGRLNYLGKSLFRRFQRLGDVADITKSVLMFEEAVRLTPDGHPDKPNQLCNLGNSLLGRFECLGDIADIMKSVSMKEEAIRCTPDDHPEKPNRLTNLGNSLFCRFKRLGDVADIMKSVSMFEKAVCLTPDGHPDKPGLLSNLGNSFILRFNHSLDSSLLFIAISHFSAAAQCSIGPISVRFNAACRWIRFAHIQGNSETLLNAYATAIALLPQLAWMGLPLKERHRVLINAAGIAREAAAAALDAGYPDIAVEWLEQGRSIVWNQFLQLRTPVDLLRVTHASLADELEQTSKQLESVSSRGQVVLDDKQMNIGPKSRSLEDEVQLHHTLTLRRETLLAHIRSLPGFDRFLLPKTIEQLIAMANLGAVVYLNVSNRRCDALIVMAELGSVIPVSLPELSYQHVDAMRRILLNRDYSGEDVLLLASSCRRNALEGWDRESGVPEDFHAHIRVDRFQLILEFLWLKVVSPVLEALTFSTPSSAVENMPRVFWCPTGPFAFLPIHAAGLYGTQARQGAKLSDFAISSYIPSLAALTPPTATDTFRHPSNIHILAVPQPSADGQSELPNVRVELNHIQRLSQASRFVTMQESDGTVEDAMDKMANADWVHFACHGVQDSLDPLDSGLCLANHRRMRLSDIIRLSRPQGGLAFLSACQTAKGDENLPEESVHLAAGMLLAGYDDVIATMWSIMDKDAPKVARDVYQHLFRDGKVPDTREAAEALHRAVVRLRDEDKVPFSSWVPFIHFGR